MTEAIQETTSAAGQGGFNAASYIPAIFGIIFVIFGAYYVTLLVARRAGTAQQGRAVQLLDRFAVDRDKLFCLLTMEGRVYLVGLTGGAVTVIDALEGEEAESLISSCRQMQNDNLIQRGVGFLTAGYKKNRFDASLSRARRKWEDEHGDSAPQELREEDGIDAVLRQLAFRKGSKNKGQEAPDDKNVD